MKGGQGAPLPLGALSVGLGPGDEQRLDDGGLGELRGRGAEAKLPKIDADGGGGAIEHGPVIAVERGDRAGPLRSLPRTQQRGAGRKRGHRRSCS